MFERCMHAIASTLPDVPPGDMHMPTVELLQAQIQSCHALSFPASATPGSLSGEHRAHAPLQNPIHITASSASTAGNAVSVGGARCRGDAVAEGTLPDTSLSCFSKCTGFHYKQVRRELLVRYPHASISVMQKGSSSPDSRSHRILIVVDAQGHLVAPPRWG